MIPVILLYYIAAVLTVLFVNYNPVLTLPQAVDSLSAYIEGSTYKLERSFAKEHGFQHGFGDTPLVHSAKLELHRLSQDPRVLEVGAYFDRLNAKVANTAAKQWAVVEPYAEPVYTKVIQPVYVALKPYAETLIAFLTPFVEAFRNHLSWLGGEIYDDLADGYAYWSALAVKGYQTYLEPYVLAVSGFLADGRHSAERYYNLTVAPFLDDHSELLTAVGILLFAYFFLPKLAFYLARFGRYFVKSVHDTTESVDTMYKEKKAVVQEKVAEKKAVKTASKTASKAPKTASKAASKSTSPAPSVSSASSASSKSSGKSTSSKSTSSKSTSSKSSAKRSEGYSAPAKANASPRTKRAHEPPLNTKSHPDAIPNPLLTPDNTPASGAPPSSSVTPTRTFRSGPSATARAAAIAAASAAPNGLGGGEGEGGGHAAPEEAHHAHVIPTSPGAPVRDGSPVPSSLDSFERAPSPTQPLSQPTTTLTQTNVYSSGDENSSREPSATASPSSSRATDVLSTLQKAIPASSTAH